MVVEQIIKKVLRKWLKKKLYNDNLPLSRNIARFEWVYNSPLKEWRDRIWVVTKCHKALGEQGLDRYLKEYIYDK